jgi:CheY-like chemotaxis protein
MAGESILIVDDNLTNLKLVRILLHGEGYDVRTAGDAELTRRLKSDGATRDITITALTAFAMKGDEQKALDAGCDGYIAKPVDTRTLPALIRDYLNRGNGAAKNSAG